MKKSKPLAVLAFGTVLAVPGTLGAAQPQNDGEFALSDAVPSATEGVRIPASRTFHDVKSVDFVHLESELARSLEACRAEPLAKLVSNRARVVEALRLDAIRTAGAANLNALAAEAPLYAAFLEMFLDSTELMTLYAGAGLVPKDTAEGLRAMAKIWACEKPADFRRYASLAVGIGATWGTGPSLSARQYGETLTGERRYDPVWRYFFYRQSWEAGRLHPNFIRLRPWEIRYLVGGQWDDGSLWWLQHRVNLPWDQYGSACWVARYTGMSPFGNSIQGPLFHISVPKEMAFSQGLVLVGGVCGGLSNTGAAAAAAHGLVSMTMGQPGHCAYGFRPERGKWIGGFGGPAGGPHNGIFPGCSPTANDVTEASFADDAHVDRCVILQAFARAGFESARERLLKAWPLNANVQREEFERLRATKAPDAAFAARAKALMKPHARYGFAYLNVVEPDWDRILSGLGGPLLARAYRLRIHEMIAQTSPTWAEKNRFVAWVEKDVAAQPAEAQGDYLGRLFALYAAGANADAYGAILAWASENLLAKGREDEFVAALEKSRAAQRGRADGKPDKDLRQTYAAAILAAEAAKSYRAIRLLTDIATGLGLSERDPKAKAAPAKPKTGAGLLDEGAFLTLSTAARSWDAPIEHLGVLTPSGGRFHTEGDAPDPSVTVHLPTVRSVRELIITKTPSCGSRMKKLRVQVSTDGATFFTVAETDDMPHEWQVVLDRPARAKWVRVQRQGDDKNFLHLARVLVYGD